MSKYDVEFKKSIVALYQNGKSQAELSREYGVSYIHDSLKQRLDAVSFFSILSKLFAEF